MPALLAGSIELFLGSDTAFYVAAMQGAKLAKLGVTMNSIGYYLMTQPDIRTLADLKGKVIGIGLGRDLPYIYLSKKLRDNNIDPKNDVKLLSLGGGQMGYMTALKTGIVQAAMKFCRRRAYLPREPASSLFQRSMPLHWGVA